MRRELPDEYSLTGSSTPGLGLTDGGRLANHLHGGRALLLDLADDSEVRGVAAGYAGRVDALTAGCPSRPKLAAVLVRPDGLTAWAADAGRGRRRRRSGWWRRWRSGSECPRARWCPADPPRCRLTGTTSRFHLRPPGAGGCGRGDSALGRNGDGGV
ncbi:hypothetical protein [Amycolatopsis minnesotensis]|uniref:aromatic-ring hydroxylase C-terminal domain-containing protein n=1 Tax=Amycolatopsis minnesotensis TaxID=337894 RepID=UPI003CD09D0C